MPCCRGSLPGDRRSTRRYLSNQLTKYLQLGRLWYNVLAATEGSVALSVELCCRAAITKRHLADIHPSLSDADDQGDGDADSDAAGDDWDAMSTASGVTTASYMSAGTTATRHTAARGPAARLAPVPEGSATLDPATAVHAALQFLKENDPEEYRRRLDMLLPK